MKKNLILAASIVMMSCAGNQDVKASAIDRANAVMVGDRLYTDIALGKKNGMLSMLVMSGETTSEMVEKATEAEKPDLIFDSVACVEL